MECFIFANENVGLDGGNSYFSRLDLLTKFSRYFKREAKNLIGRMQSDQFNMRQERGINLFETLPQVPLASNDPTILPFLKCVSGLSRQ